MIDRDSAFEFFQRKFKQLAQEEEERKEEEESLPAQSVRTLAKSPQQERQRPRPRLQKMRQLLR